ncbi:zinc-finger homeodomain protein 2-like [Humulus lupulus]|uniref:zinc-finger homeodomain protein 2-like n=1 Tax=Humulus lupulus TaxID=3486 RepID=UPI002B409D46|nr:zinc-finger homeodomain protein 2-like [Humulus lupulus]
MEFDDQDPDEDMGEIPMAPLGYDSSGARTKTGGVEPDGGTSSTNSRKGGIRYRECQKNHAVSIGRHALDGCCEFMAAGEEGTLDVLKCAACNCHRNFHRKESTDGSGATSVSDHHNNYKLYHHGHQFSSSPYYRAPQPSGYLHHLNTPQAHRCRPLALPGVTSSGGQSREEGEDASIPSSSGGGGGSKKRYRTKFTAEQKEKMLEFSERIGWRIQKHDEATVEQFCLDTGVNRHVLKVWMHNNKHTLARKP